MSFSAHHGIENDEQLAHAGGECQFGMFTAGAQPQIEDSDSWIAADSRHRCHVQHSPDLGTPAPDAAAAAQAATVAVEGRQANQGGDLLAIESSQLGQRCQQDARQHLPDPGNRAQQLGALTPERSVTGSLC
jgi:hypothetical protein